MIYHVNVFKLSFRGERMEHLFDGVVNTDVLINVIKAYSEEGYKIEVEMLKEGDED